MSDNLQMFHVTGVKGIEVDIAGSSIHDVARQFMKVNGFYPETVGAYGVVGACERCEAPIFYGEGYGQCEIDSTLMCAGCLNETTKPVDDGRLA